MSIQFQNVSFQIRNANLHRYGMDLMAPGEEVTGASVDGRDDYAEWTGTSMAAPMVAGAALAALGSARDGRGQPQMQGVTSMYGDVGSDFLGGGRRRGRGDVLSADFFSPAAVKRALLNGATEGVLWDARGGGGGATVSTSTATAWPVTTATTTMTSSLPGSPNLLLYSNPLFHGDGDLLSSTEEGGNKARVLSSVSDSSGSPVSGAGGLAAGTMLTTGARDQPTSSHSPEAHSSTPPRWWCPSWLRLWGVCQ